MLQVALGWELYERTHSALALGLVGLATALPVIILALPAGHLADRIDRKKILVWAQVAFIVAGFALAALSYWRGPVPLVFAVLLARGAAQAYNNPARQALLPQLVPAETFGNAVTLNNVQMSDPWATYPGGDPFPTAINKDTPFSTFGLVSTHPYNSKPTVVNQWNLSVQRQLGTDWLVTANYIGSSTIHVRYGNKPTSLPTTPSNHGNAAPATSLM